MFSWLSLIPFVGKIIDGLSAYAQKKQDVALEKYKVDGTVNVQLINQETEVVKARQALLAAGQQYLGVRIMQYGFVYPLIVWFASIVFYCLFHPYFPQIKPILAFPDPLNQWAGWMVMYLFLHTSVQEYLKK
ncbi:hypothetical protein [Bradyrhizobium erythrophlei]|uniref:Holin of 3TMs, for gene-transfer release n=1 Tax=Bradyrhizobium erythrophlei TaxID=1437360 RepID=A0A1M5T7S2_9BRAD|nr:hypothetical protein [Bradyrhizobium erythrophlei]SHH46789.1 hypothetical protein SAMN05444169_7603 [Bradyrhizobium erythrophlei]